MNETLQEFVDSRGATPRVERQQGIIRGVKILGIDSRNGRRYSPEAIARAAALYEGAKVNVNHPKGSPAAPRDYQDRIGVIRNVSVRGEEGLFADFHYNPSHALSEQLAWDAEHSPENVGFSHNVLARTARHGQETIVEEILRVQSVDLVADPATTLGLFEAAAAPASQDPSLASLTVQQLQEHRPELIQEILAPRAAELRELQSQLEELRAAESERQRRDRIKTLLREFQLPDADSADPWAQAAVSPRFLQQLLAAPDEPALRELLEERARLIRAARDSAQSVSASGPLSREQRPLEAPSVDNLKAFVAAIT